MTRELLTIQQTSKLLACSYSRAAQLVRDGILPCIRLGRQIRIDPIQLESFFAKGGQPLDGGWRKSQR